MKNLLLLLLAVFLSGCAAAMDKGAVCFTFDDYAGANWLKADKIFKKYTAHVTFFVVGNLTPQKLEVMKKLQAAGHSVGLHTLGHRDAVEVDMQSYFDEQILPQLKSAEKYGVEHYLFDGVHPYVAGAELIAKKWVALWKPWVV